MEDEQSVQQVFDGAYSCLEEDGVFYLMCIPYIKSMKSFLIIAIITKPMNLPFFGKAIKAKKTIALNTSDLFVAQENGLFERLDELHQERTYPLESYLRMLENAGFANVNAMLILSIRSQMKKSRRWFFVCHSNRYVKQEDVDEGLRTSR